MTTIRFLDLTDVLEIHELRVDLYGGSKGIRDLGLLQSAIAQPQAGFGGQYLHTNIYEMAAAYLFHIVKNHPFIDDNKRTGLAACPVFLDLNGVEIEADAEKLEELTVSVAEGVIDKPQAANFFQQAKQRKI